MTHEAAQELEDHMSLACHKVHQAFGEQRQEIWRLTAEAVRLEDEIVDLKDSLHMTNTKYVDEKKSVDKARSEGFAVGLIFAIVWFAVIGLIAWIAL